MDARQRKLLERRRREFEDHFKRVNYERSIMAISPNLGSFKYLGQGEQGVMLLNHLALLFGKRTFDPHKAPEEICGFVFTKGLAYSSAELQDAHVYLLTHPLSWIAYGGFVAEAPPGSGMYEITDKGWALVESKDDDYLPF
jgi:hypothetical protein